MKSISDAHVHALESVAPLVGAWIEMSVVSCTFSTIIVAPLVGAWIEMPWSRDYKDGYYVAPLVGAWIEIPLIFL